MLLLLLLFRGYYLLECVSAKVLEDVALGMLKQSECNRTMMILQWRDIVISVDIWERYRFIYVIWYICIYDCALPERQLGACINLVDIVVARMIEVMADAGHQ